MAIAREFIISRLSAESVPEHQLKAEARKRNITDYAFNTAIRILKDEGRIEAVKASGQGHRKMLRLVKPYR